MAHATAPANTLTHAVVVGAGIGGLLTAQALSRHVDRVTVVERDSLPSAPTARPGVPQGRHVHVLQPGGLAAIEGLLPGFGDELVTRGAVPVVVPRDLLWQSSAGWMRPQEGRGHVVLSASRELIEAVTRDLVLDRSADRACAPGSRWRPWRVRDGRVAGVDVRPRGAGAGEPTERIVADLVVDSSGRRSKAPDWLEAAGFDRPEEEVIDADLSYATRIYRRGPDDLNGWAAVLLQPKPPGCRRMGVMFPIEGDRWMVTIAGANGDVPPTDEDGFLAFATGMRTPLIGDAIERLEPLGPIVSFRKTANRRRHYDQLRRCRDGFLVVGDAACAFNPVYGQGMSVAALTAAETHRSLRAHLADRAADLADATADLQRAVARINAAAWMVATGADLRFPGTVGRSATAADRVVHRYLDRVVLVAASDPVANAAYVDVVTMTALPTSLLRPALAARVLTRRSPRPSAGTAGPADATADGGGGTGRADGSLAVPSPTAAGPEPTGWRPGSHAVVMGAGPAGRGRRPRPRPHDRAGHPDRPGRRAEPRLGGEAAAGRRAGGARVAAGGRAGRARGRGVRRGRRCPAVGGRSPDPAFPGTGHARRSAGPRPGASPGCWSGPANGRRRRPRSSPTWWSTPAATRRCRRGSTTGPTA